jgi:hypothetical protein
LQIVERARREGRWSTEGANAETAHSQTGRPIPPPIKLGPMQKIIAFGPLA